MTADGIPRDGGSPAGPPSPKPLQGIAVVIAEDTWHTAISLQRLVERNGGRIAGMASNLADLERLGAAGCDAVIMDLNLNGQLAYDTASRLAALGRKVIVLSGYRRPPDIDSRIHAFLEKPASSEALISALLS